MDIFIVIKDGVYRHDIVGAWFQVEHARDAAEAAIRAEHDDYHTFDVIQVTVGTTGEKTVLTCKRKDIKTVEDGHRKVVSFELEWKEH